MPDLDTEESELTFEDVPAQDEDSRKRRLWASLLVVDVVVLFILGAVIADLVYLRVSTPPLAPAVTGRKHGKPELPAQAEPAKAEPAKAQSSKEPQAPAATLVKLERPAGSPAVHAAAIPARAAQPLATASAKAAPASPTAAPGAHAKPVEFSHRAPRSREVLLRGPFLVRSGGKKAMTKGADGFWRLSVSLLPGTYKFHYLVDGKRTPTESLKID